jgi:hypothetical protein
MIFSLGSHFFNFDFPGAPSFALRRVGTFPIRWHSPFRSKCHLYYFYPFAQSRRSPSSCYFPARPINMDERLATKRTTMNGSAHQQSARQATSAAASPEARQFRESRVPCAIREALKYSTLHRQIAFPPETGCRIEFALTHSKQTIGVHATRNSNRGVSAHALDGFSAPKMISSRSSQAMRRAFLIDTLAIRNALNSNQSSAATISNRHGSGVSLTARPATRKSVHVNLHSSPDAPRMARLMTSFLDKRNFFEPSAPCWAFVFMGDK